MPTASARAVGEFLEELAVLMELGGADAFRLRAYLRAARIFATLDEDVEELVSQGSLTSIKGVGKGLANQIAEFVGSGFVTTRDFEELKASIPPGLLDMLRIPGLGTKKIRLVHDKLGIDTLDALAEACRQEYLSTLPGFGTRTQVQILEGIEFVRRHHGWFRLDAAMAAAKSLGAALAAQPHTARISPAGPLRRHLETIGSIDLVLSSDNPGSVAAACAAHEEVVEVSEAAELNDDGGGGTTVRLKNGMKARLRIVSEEAFPFALRHLTGSAEHNEQLCARARTMGLELREDGLFRGGERLPCATEAEIFEALGLGYIPPELREGAGEIAAAGQGALPGLVTSGDIRGLLHVHSTYSDGSDSLAAMAAAAEERGYSYLGISDHSRSAAYAGGLKEEDIHRQHEEIDALNKAARDFHIFRGIESDIRADGNLDYDDDLLSTFDFVVASVHARFNMSEAEMTRRIVRAIKHPATTMLGHLTGRLLLDREGYAVDVDAIIAAAAEHRTAIEINASPARLDMDWRHVRNARDRGVRLAVNTDAHSIAGLDNLHFGIGIARKGWLRSEDVINTLDTEAVAAYFKVGS